MLFLTLHIMQSTATKSFLATPIEYLKGVGPERADILEKRIGDFYLSVIY
jgi:hypothetical protein